MVGKLREFVASRISRCWAALLRSLPADGRALGGSLFQGVERPLGRMARFRLASSSSQNPATAELSGEIGEALNATRQAFATGKLFGPLESVTSSGAVLVAHITERGFINADHFLAVYPNVPDSPKTELVEAERAGLNSN